MVNTDLLWVPNRNQGLKISQLVCKFHNWLFPFVIKQNKQIFMDSGLFNVTICCFCVFFNWMSSGSGLLVSQKQTFEDVTLGTGFFFTHFVNPKNKLTGSVIISCSRNRNTIELMCGMSRSAWKNWKQCGLLDDTKWNMVFCFEGCLLIAESDVTAWLQSHAEERSALHSKKFPATAAGAQDSPSASCCSPVLSQIPLPFLQRFYHKLCPDCPCRIAANPTIFWTTEFSESGCQVGVEKPSSKRGGNKILKDYCLASTGNSWCVHLVCRSQSDWVVTAGWN